MLEMWDLGKFNKDVMMEWTGRAPNIKTYAYSVPFFEAKELKIGKFEASGGPTKKNAFATAHVVMNDKTYELLALIVQKDTEREERERCRYEKKCRNSAPPSSTSASRGAADTARDGSQSVHQL